MRIFSKIFRKRTKYSLRNSTGKSEGTESKILSLHEMKQLTIHQFRNEYGCKILVETGTYLGEMVEAQKSFFSIVYSIELGMELYKQARIKFQNDKNVLLFWGDSGKVLPSVMSQINEPAIFWLDGHYSEGITVKGEKDCPIYEELDSIFNSTPLNHVLLIDDARLFIGKNDYPTFDELTKYIKARKPESKINVKDDIINVILKS